MSHWVQRSALALTLIAPAGCAQKIALTAQIRHAENAEKVAALCGVDPDCPDHIEAVLWALASEAACLVQFSNGKPCVTGDKSDEP